MENIVTPIRKLLSICLEAQDYFEVNLLTGDPAVIADLLNTEQLAVTKLTEFFQQRQYKNLLLYGKNILHSLDKAKQALQKEDFAGGYAFLCYEIGPCLEEIKRLLSFETEILPYPERWLEYRRQREARLRENVCMAKEKRADYSYKVSIVLIAYNKLEYTKAAVESIYKYTDFSSGKYELITLNNGSSDGTEEYFASLPNVKKINLKYNIIGTNVCSSLIEGEYSVGYSNDVIATTNWLEQLVSCMESDQNIVMVVPTCNLDAISNFQGVPIPYPNALDQLAEIDAFARDYNKSDSKKWEERPLLMPFLALVRTAYYQDFSCDALYTQLEFIDDDLSTSFRRAGLKQVLAKDTFMHHFGSITLREAQRENKSLENMRRVYYSKWGVDAWESRGSFPGQETVLSWRVAKTKDQVLFIEPRFGAGFLELKNFYRRKDLELGECAAVVKDLRYLDDAKGMFSSVYTAGSLRKVGLSVPGSYDIIQAGAYLNELIMKGTIGFLESLYQLLKPGGMMILPVANYSGVHWEIKRILGNGFMKYHTEESEENLSTIELKALQERLKKHALLNKFKLHTISFADDETLTKHIQPFFSRIFELDTTAQKELYRRLCYRMFFLVIFKDK